jgi:cobalamin biosynthesis Mg chelatase CobN
LAIIGTPVADITPLAVRTRAEGDSISSVQSDPLFLEDAGGALETRQILTETATDLDSDRSETLAELQGLTKLTADAIAIEQEGGVNRTAEELADETKTERNGQDTSLLIILVVLVVALAALFIWSGRRSRGA